MLQTLRRLSLGVTGLIIPFEHLHVELGPIPVTPAKAVVALLLLIVGIQWVTERLPLPRDAARPWVVVLAASVVVSAGISIAKGTPPIPVFKLASTWFALFLFYWVLTYTLRTRRDVDLLIVTAGIGSVLVIVSALAGIGYQAEAKQGIRAGGLGGNVNQVAHNLEIFLALILAVFLSQRSSFAKAVLVGIMVILLVGITTTLSRAGYAALGAMAVLWLVRTGSVGLIRYGVPTALAAAIALVLAPPAVYERLDTMNPFTSSPGGVQDSALAESLEGRTTHQFPNALSMLASNPLTGMGLLRTIPYAYEYGIPYDNVIHNNFLQVAGEQGLLGLVPFVMIHVLFWRNMTRVRRAAERPERRRDPELRHLRLRALLMQVALLGAIVNGMAHPALRHKPLWLMFALSPILYNLARDRLAREPAREEVSAAPPAVAGSRPVYAGSREALSRPATSP